MSYLFSRHDTKNFNKDISEWNVGNVKDMESMFQGSKFNQDLSEWDVSNVQNMSSMFSDFSEFNQDISGWYVGNLKYTTEMFKNNRHFKGPLNRWRFNQIDIMDGMFENSAYDNDDGNLEEWGDQIRRLEPDMDYMFENSEMERKGTIPEWYSTEDEERSLSESQRRNALLLLLGDENPPFLTTGELVVAIAEVQKEIEQGFPAYLPVYGGVALWDVSQIIDMSYLFSRHDTKNFNKDISGWDVSNVTNMDGMFESSKFNQPIGDWDVSGVTSMTSMFEYSNFNQPLEQWGARLGNVKDMNKMFYGSNFNQDISNWDVSGVWTMTSMFTGTPIELNSAQPSWYTVTLPTIQMHPDYPYLHEKVNLQELPNVSPITLENMPSTCYDFIEGDVDTIEYINEDVDHVAFIYGSEGNYNTTCMSRGDLKTMFSDSTGNNLFYKCTHPDILRDIDTSQTYFKLALITGVIFIPAEYMVSVIENTEHNLFLVVCAGEEIKHSVGYTYYHNLAPEAGVSTWHCGPGSNLPLCTLTPISLGEIEDGTGQPNQYKAFTSKEELRQAIVTLRGIHRYVVLTRYGPIKDWDVTRITDMSNLFSGEYSSPNKFDEDISGWDVSNVTNMESMFENSIFNQPIGDWDVSSVVDMSYMFHFSVFNQPLEQWGSKLGNVKNMEMMFYDSPFNQDINNWDVGNVQNMDGMFEGSKFNRYIGNWDVGNVQNMDGMFSHSLFNQDISSWKVGNVKNMENMFGSSQFNQDISGWNVSNVKNMSLMFTQSQFNQDISGWDVSNVTNMEGMFAESQFNQDINSWNVNISVVNIEEIFIHSELERQGNLPDWYTGVVNPEDLFYWAERERRDRVPTPPVRRWYDREMHPGYPWLHEKVNLQELSNILPITLENMPPICYDFIEGDVDTIEYINEDVDHVAFIYGSEGNYNTTCMSRGDLKTMFSDSTGNNLFYKCALPDTLRGINTAQTYFKLALITGVIFIPAEYMVSVIENTEHNLFLVVCAGEEIEYSVGYTYYHNLAPEAGVSTWHCNPGSNLPLCTLTPISF